MSIIFGQLENEYRTFELLRYYLNNVLIKEIQEVNVETLPRLVAIGTAVVKIQFFWWLKSVIPYTRLNLPLLFTFKTHAISC